MKDQAKIIRSTLFVLFFLSGLSALIYQVIWIRMLGQVFGLTLFAVTTVLTAYMAGLALGSLFFGKIIDKLQDQLSLFLFLELGIGVFALLFPLLLKLFTGAYVALTRTIQPDLYLNSLLRFLSSFILLLFPTFLMGGTLPVLSRYYIRNLQQLGGHVGGLYAVNNLGAVLGCFMTSFVLIRIVGLAACLYMAAALNILIAAAVLVIRFKAAPTAPVTTERETAAVKLLATDSYPAPVLRLVLWVFAIEGFTTLAYEVIWTRILISISYDRSVYFYATVIIAFIAGLSLGSWLISLFVDRKRNLVFILAVIEIAIGFTACLVLIFFVPLSAYINAARAAYAESWLLSLGREYFLFFLLMIVPAALMGMTFPIVARIYTTNMDKLGSKLGIIGCLDTIGSLFGSFIAGFVLIPFTGVVKAVLITAALNALLGISLLVFNPLSKFKIKVWAVSATICLALLALRMLPQERYFKHWQTETEGDRLLYYKEGMGSTVAVAQKFDGVKELAIDGAVTAIAEYGDIRVHKLLAYLPYLFCKQPRKALVVGFGMGITTQALIQEEMEEVTCVEICEEVIAGSARSFLAENKDVLKEPKLKIVIEDGRSYMAITPDKYDVITTNAVHPRLSINIYTQEFYELCKERLTPGGIMCQWMTTNLLSETEYKMLIKSFTMVFPHTTLWISNIGHILLVGTPAPLSIDFRVLLEKLSIPKIKADLQEVHLDNPYSLLALYACTGEELAGTLQDIPPNTDDFPLPEFSRYVGTIPNLKVIRALLALPRNTDALVVNWPDPGARTKLGQYIEAEKSFLNARYASFEPAAGHETENLEKAIALNPTNYHFHDTLGKKYTALAEYTKAEAEYKSMIALSKQNPLGYIGLMELYFLRNKYDSAYPYAREVLNIDPENGLAHYYLYLIHWFNGRFGEAARELETVTALYPSLKRAHFELGEVYEALQRYKDAKQAYARYAQLELGDSEVRARLAALKRRGF